MQKKELEDARKWTEIGLKRRIGEGLMEKLEHLTGKKTKKCMFVCGTR